MSDNRRRRRHYIDVGEGVTIATSLRGPLNPKTEDALRELARVTAARMRAGDLPPSRRGAQK